MSIFNLAGLKILYKESWRAIEYISQKPRDGEWWHYLWVAARIDDF